MPLEDLERRLYSRTPPPIRPEEGFQGDEKHIRIASGWSEEAQRKESALLGIIKTVMPWLNRILVASIIFFLFAGGVALVGLLRGGNTISPNRISLSALGPVSAPAGEELAFEITVGNYNESELSSVDLVVEYPPDTRKPGALSEPLLRYRESLGALAAQATVTRRLSLVPFGEQGAEKKIVVSVEYRAKGSNAIFSRESDYSFAINAAPVTVRVVAPKEVSSGQVFEIAIELTSNSSVVIRNLLMKAEYPNGFRPTASAPPASFGDNLWQFGDLAPLSKQKLLVSGRLDVAENEERVFRFSVGTESPKDEKALGTLFLIESPSVIATKPPVALEMLVNGTRGETFIVAKPGPLRVDARWSNNLAVKLTDLEITVTLDGAILNPSSVAGSGRYDAAARSIVWDKRERARFAAIEPGENGTESFSFSLLPIATDPTRFKNASMMLHLFVRGKRLDEAGAVQDLVSTLSKEIRVASTLSLGTRLSFSGGPFTNSGPIPPKVGSETTYTVTWSLSNSSNSVSGARVSATLPPFVRWVGTVSPPGEKVSYMGDGGEVVWEAGDIAGGVGFGASPREVSFQVSLLPSVGQGGSAPVVIGAAQASANDRFTSTEIESATRPALTTNSLAEGTGNGIVAK